MASKSGAIRAGKAFVELFVDDSAAQRGLMKFAGRMKATGAIFAKVGAGFAAFGSAITTPILAATGVFADAGSELADMSARTGVAVEALSQLKYAAEQSGGSMELLETGLKGMQKNITAAAGGSAAMIEAFDSIGVSVGELAGLKPDEQFGRLADALAKIDDPGTRAALAMKVFGKAGQQLLPLLSGGAAGLAAMRKEAEALGLTMSTEDAAAAEAFGDAVDRLKAQLRQVVIAVGSSVVPTLMQFLDATRGALRGAIDFAKENKPLVASIFAIGVASTAAGAALIGVGGILAAAGMAVSGLSAGLGMLASGLAFVATPAGAVLAIVGGLAGAFVYSATKSLEWASALSTLHGAWQGVSAALQSGDLKAAADIAFLAVQIAWSKMVDGLLDEWSKVHQAVSEVGAGLVGRIIGDAGKGVADVIGQHQGDRTKRRHEREADEARLAAMIAAAAAKVPPAAAPVPVVPPASTVPPAGFSPGEVARQRERQAGTMSALSDRMFGGTFNRKSDTWKSLDEIAENTKGMVKKLDSLSKKAMVYTRG